MLMFFPFFLQFVGFLLVVLALAGVLFKLRFPNWLVPPGHPLVSGLIGAAFFIIGAREFDLTAS